MIMNLKRHKKWKDHKFYRLASNVYRENQLEIFKLLKGINASNLLDIGCGDGLFTIECAEIVGAKEMYGIEINEKMQKRLKTEV